jgi:hypothetical protein
VSIDLWGLFDDMERASNGYLEKVRPDWRVSGAYGVSRGERRPGILAGNLTIGCDMIDPHGLDADSEPDIGRDCAHLTPPEPSAQAAGYCLGSPHSNR